MTSTPGFLERNACPACGGAPTGVCDLPMDAGDVRTYLESFYRPVGGIDFARLHGARFRLSACAACATVWQADVPDQDLALELYEHWIDPERSFRRFHVGRPLPERLAVVRELATGIAWLGLRGQPIRFLDLGGGWGEWCDTARTLGCEATLAELSPSRIAHARNRGLRILDGSESAAAFDLVNLEQVLEHVANPAQMLADATRLLAPEGLLRICVPNGWDSGRRLRRMDWNAAKGTRWSLNLVSPLEHINCFTATGLGELAERCNLVRVRPPLRLWLRHGFGQFPTQSLRSLAEWLWHSSPWSTRWWLRHRQVTTP